MKRIYKIGAIIVLFALYIMYYVVMQSSYATYPGLSKGEIFISDESFYSDNELFLAGEWEFYFGELLDSAGFDAKEQREFYFLPDYWQRDWNDQSVEINGYGSYRVTIGFETAKETVALNIPWVFGAYEVYANGESVLQCGSVGTEASQEIPETRSRFVSIALHSDKLELIIHVSGHVSGLSGLLHPIAIGSAASVLQNNAMQIAQDAAFIGCFLIMGFYHFAMFFLRRKDKATFYFALLCFTAMLRQGTISYGLLYSIMTKSSGFFMYDIYVLSSIWLVALFGVFSYYLFGKQYSTDKKHIQLLIACSIIKTAVGSIEKYNFAFFSFYLFYVCMLLCIIYVLRVIYWIYKQKDANRFLYMYGVLLLLLANGADILRDFGVVKTNYLVGNTSFVIFTFIETVILARTYIGYSYENERLINSMEALVEERTAELAGANEQLRLLEQIKNELLSNISHDLRTPMTAIRGYMELLMAQDTGAAEAREYIEGAHARTGQMENLIKDLFLLTQLIEKSMPVDIASVPAAGFFQACYKTYKPVTESKGLELLLHIDVGSANMRADNGFLLRIMDNLMQNALHYARTEICIEAKIEEGYIAFSVVDDGPGIAAEALPYVFDRFFKKRKDGAGLGLCIVKELAAAMGGDVSAQSVPNERTEFKIRMKL